MKLQVCMYINRDYCISKIVSCGALFYTLVLNGAQFKHRELLFCKRIDCCVVCLHTILFAYDHTIIHTTQTTRTNYHILQ